jgi:hypothetical protein
LFLKGVSEVTFHPDSEKMAEANADVEREYNGGESRRIGMLPKRI